VSWNIAELQIGVSNDGGGPPWPIETAGASGSQSLDKLHLANWPQFLGAIGTVHGAGFNEHGGADIVAAVDVVGQFMQEIALVGYAVGPEIPKVVMGIADGNLRFQRRFLGQC
jgi:hypothetical protein